MRAEQRQERLGRIRFLNESKSVHFTKSQQEDMLMQLAIPPDKRNPESLKHFTLMLEHLNRVKMLLQDNLYECLKHLANSLRCVTFNKGEIVQPTNMLFVIAVQGRLQVLQKSGLMKQKQAVLGYDCLAEYSQGLIMGIIILT